MFSTTVQRGVGERILQMARILQAATGPDQKPSMRARVHTPEASSPRREKYKQKADHRRRRRRPATVFYQRGGWCISLGDICPGVFFVLKLRIEHGESWMEKRGGVQYACDREETCRDHH